MGRTVPEIRMLILDEDPILTADVGAFVHPGVSITMASDGLAASTLIVEHHFDVIAIELSTPGGWDLLIRLGEQAGAPTLIALAAQARAGETLEYTLTIAELRGARAAFPKPVEVVELAAIAASMIARPGQRKPQHSGPRTENPRRRGA